MSFSLKSTNAPLLTLVVIANMTFYVLVLRSGLDLSEWPAVFDNIFNYVPAAVASLIVGALNSQLKPIIKERLVFWRWDHPLPGTRAFSEVMNSDARINPAALLAHQNPLPTDPAEQNRLWFRWYQDFKDDPSILNVHRQYLLFRDWSSLSLLLAPVFWFVSLFQMSWPLSVIVASVMLFQYLLVMVAARNQAERFVASVLACKAAQSPTEN